MPINRLVLLLSLFLFVCWGCRPAAEVEPPKSSQNQLLSFAFEPLANPSQGLSTTLTASIGPDRQVLLTVPARMAVTGLKATFTVSSKATVTVNGVAQQSGVTANDFSAPVTYRVTAEDGSTAEYRVVVTVQRSSGNQLLSFVFAQTANAGLSQDITLPVSSTQVNANYLVTLPTGTSLQTLKPTFSVSPGATVSVGGQVQQSGSTAQDFTKPVMYRITAEDGTTRDVTVEASVQVDLPTVENAVRAFMDKYAVPGMSVAITRDERLVYAKGYGVASRERNEPVTNQTLFRIASVSKPITAIAILKLVDEGKLQLDQKVFGVGGVLSTTYGRTPYTPQLEQITVRQLVDHTAGGDAWNHLWDISANRIDPFYQRDWLGFTQVEVLSAVIDTRPVTQTPGTRNVYSNVSSNFAGRVIERVTGMSYERYVQENILKPIGIQPATMRIGGDKLTDRYPNETVYYNPYPGYDQPYDFPMGRFDAHGGWVSTSINLVRLLSYADGMPNKRDLLSTALWQAMVTPNPVSIPSGGYAGYGLGWNASRNGVGVAYWHSGGMAGTASYLLKIGNFTFAILINTRSAAPDFYTAIDRLCYEMSAELTLNTFMKGDQFDVIFGR